MALTVEYEVMTQGERRKRECLVAASTAILKGGLVAWNATGYLVAAADTANFDYAGIATESAANGSGGDGDLSCMVEYNQIVYIANSSATQAWVGKPIYATADDTVGLVGANISQMGRCVSYDATGATTDGKGEGVYIDTSQKA